jgi:hypothetical protein
LLAQALPACDKEGRDHGPRLELGSHQNSLLAPNLAALQAFHLAPAWIDLALHSSSSSLLSFNSIVHESINIYHHRSTINSLIKYPNNSTY